MPFGTIWKVHRRKLIFFSAETDIFHRRELIYSPQVAGSEKPAEAKKLNMTPKYKSLPRNFEIQPKYQIKYKAGEHLPQLGTVT